MSDDPFNTEIFKAQFHKEVESGKSSSSGGSSEGYTYIAKLLLTPVTDGRNRLLWLVLAPYAISILKMNRESAIDMITKYFKACDELSPCPKVLSLVEQYVDYVPTIEGGLKPPKQETLMTNDPDLWAIVSRAIGEKE